MPVPILIENHLMRDMFRHFPFINACVEIKHDDPKKKKKLMSKCCGGIVSIST